MVKFIISALGLDPDNVAYICLTGKAASVLRHKGCPNAMTAHKLLYYTKKTPSGKYKITPRPYLEKQYDLIICDEISMLPNYIWEQLLSHHIPVIALGDPFQIPPIDKKTDNKVLEHPHIFLDEIMRQAKESEIIRLSMDIRNYEWINYQSGKEVLVIPKEEAVIGTYTWGDQIICATNKRRKEINDFVRSAFGFSTQEPQKGDKVIATRNEWDITDTTNKNALVNGTIGYLGDIEKGIVDIFMLHKRVPIIKTSLSNEEDGLFTNLKIDYENFTKGTPCITSKESYQLYKSKASFLEPTVLDYGYAISGHRAQGSQWDKVVVEEENFPFDREEHARWLYTCCTRSASKLVLIR